MESNAHARASNPCMLFTTQIEPQDVKACTWRTQVHLCCFVGVLAIMHVRMHASLSMHIEQKRICWRPTP